MESKLGKQISNFCRLDFTNSVVKKPKGLFYSKNVVQNPINFRKKSEKISLKNFNQDLASPDVKTILKKHQQIKPQPSSIRKPNKTDTKNLSIVKSNTRQISPKLEIKKLSQSQQPYKIKLHKSLQQQPQRVHVSKRNPVEDLKNIGLKKIAASQKNQRIIKFYPSNNIIRKNQVNLANQNAFSYQKISTEPQIDNMNHQILVQKKYQPQIPFIKQLNQSIQKIKTPQISQKKSQTQKQNIELSNVSQKCKQSLTSTQPQQQNTKHKNLLKIEKFRQFYGEFQIQEEIKFDLLNQKQALENKMQNQIQTMDKDKTLFPSQYKSNFNPEQSLKSLKQLNKKSENYSLKKTSIQKPVQEKFYLSCDKQKPQTLNTSSQFEKIQQYPSFDLQGYQFKTEQRLRKSSISIESQVSIQAEYINSLQFREKCQLTENFKSIISVHSESVSDEEVQTSVIINKNPKEIVSSRPIRTLF